MYEGNWRDGISDDLAIQAELDRPAWISNLAGGLAHWRPRAPPPGFSPQLGTSFRHRPPSASSAARSNLLYLASTIKTIFFLVKSVLCRL